MCVKLDNCQESYNEWCLCYSHLQGSNIYSYYVGTANSMEVRRVKVYKNTSLPFVSGKEKWQLTLQSKIQCNLHSKNNHQGTTRSHWMLEIYRMDWTSLPQTVASMILHRLWSHFLHIVWSWKSNDSFIKHFVLI